MTEDDMRDKWCKDRALIAAIRRFDPRGPDVKCIASDCAHWTWTAYRETWVKSTDDPHQELTDIQPISKHGHCGLTGKRGE